MLLVLDSNIWLNELGLRSPLGAVARFFIRQKQARIAIPEVVQLEVEQNLRSRLTEYISKIQDHHRQLLTVFGKLKEVVLPDGTQVEEPVREVFAGLDVDVLKVPFSLESARSSLLKTINKVPPSGEKNQQFKDGVLWADCVALLEEDDVHLVTSDTDFYQDRKYDKGLAQNLRDEISSAKHSFTLSPSLTDLLRDLRTEFILDEELLSDALLRTFQKDFDRMLAHQRFRLGPRLSTTKTLYATENPNRLFVEFSLEFEAKELVGDGRSDGVLTLPGDGVYDVKTASFSELRNFGEELKFRTADLGEQRVKSTVIHAGTAVIGHREVSHTVRHKLD